jgi:hypothetical protein
LGSFEILDNTGFERIAPAVSAVLLEQLTRLKSFVETGKPTHATGVSER